MTPMEATAGVRKCRYCGGIGLASELLEIGPRKRMHVKCFSQCYGEASLTRLPVEERAKVRAEDVRPSTRLKLQGL